MLESGVFFTSTESELAGVDSDILFRLAGSPVGDWMKWGRGTFAVRIVSVRRDVLWARSCDMLSLAAWPVRITRRKKNCFVMEVV
jgi:hypothetical protein